MTERAAALRHCVSVVGISSTQRSVLDCFRSAQAEPRLVMLTAIGHPAWQFCTDLSTLGSPYR